MLADQSNLTLGVRTPTPGKKAGVEDGSAAKRSRLSSAFKERSKRGHVEATLNDHIRPENDAVVSLHCHPPPPMCGGSVHASWQLGMPQHLSRALSSSAQLQELH